MSEDLKALPGNVSESEVVNVSYTNWWGETKVRRVILSGTLRYGTNDWHQEPTWLISAFDLDHPAQIWEEFDLAKCDFNRDYMPREVEALRVKAARMAEALRKAREIAEKIERLMK